MPGGRRKKADSASAGPVAAAGAGASGTKRGRKKKAATSNDEELPQAPAAAAAAAASSSATSAATATTNSSSSKAADKRKELLRTQFDTLDAEMELVGFGKNERGQNKRKLPRKQSLVRTQKRKVLDRRDREERAIQANVIRPKRLRGAKVAFEDEVVGGSMIFGGETDNDDGGGGAASKPEAAGGSTRTQGDEEGDEDAWESGMASSFAGDNDAYSGGSRSPSPVPPSASTGGQPSPATTSSSKTKRARGGQRVGREDALEEAREAIRTGSAKISRTMYRLKNFKSHKLVERQGQALGAHARGEHKEAIAKLAEVAEAAPLAPQVYSTLGLVYENMLREKNTEDVGMDGSGSENDADGEGVASTEAGSANSNAATSETVGGQRHKAIHSKLEIAKKAYGSYHIAAVMCKKDFTLWVRAGDAALDIADMYSDLITSGDCSTTDLAEYTTERKKWTGEAKNDFQAADNLQPPGISIPSKLAAVQMELGNLSEALSILTDCNNQSQATARTSGGARSDMEKNYGVWLLYADLMLRIGFGCQQWNKGIHSNDNYMFRRWLRKYSKTFDWKERRLQALCMALEAAAGSSACSKFVEWLRLRALQSRPDHDDGRNGGSGGGGFDSDRWKVSDAYESDQQKEQAAGAAAAKAGDDGDGENSGDASVISTSENATSKEVGADKVADGGEEESPGLSRDGQTFEEKREALLSSNKAELLAFDEETERMKLSANSKEAREREMSRGDLVKKHRSSVVALVGEHYQSEQAKKDRAQATQSSGGGRVGGDPGNSRDPLPMSASCATVCNIASQLMKQCIELQLFQGSSLVGEVVSSYLKERVQRRERKQSSIPDSNPLFLSQNPFDMHLAYDNIDGDGESDSEGSVDEYFSDDEDLDSPSKAAAIEGMRNGVLPDELQVLVGLSLLAEGGKNYTAQRALSATARLEDDSTMTTTSARGYLSDWSLFSHPLVGITTKTSFFALTASLVRRMGDDKAKNCLELISLFQEYVESLGSTFSNTNLARSTPGSGDFRGEVKAKTREIFLSLLKLFMIRAREESLNVEHSNGNFEERCKNSLALLDFVIQYEDTLWDGRVHGLSSTILPSDSEVLGVLSEVFSTLVEAKEAEICLTPSSTQSSEISLELMDPVLAKLRHVLSVFLCISMDMTPPEAKNAANPVSNSTLPLSSNWQSAAHKNLSRRAFNFCVGYAVTSSNLAWRPDGSFLLDAIMKAAGDSNFVGISLSYDETSRAWVCGILPEKVELELASQLQMLQSEVLVEASISDDFSAAFQTIKETDWYSRATDKLQRQGGREILSRGGEEAGMILLLLLSRSHLNVARELDPKDSLKKQTMVKMVLSIVLPIVSCFLFILLTFHLRSRDIALLSTCNVPIGVSSLNFLTQSTFIIGTLRPSSAQARRCGIQPSAHVS